MAQFGYAKRIWISTDADVKKASAYSLIAPTTNSLEVKDDKVELRTVNPTGNPIVSRSVGPISKPYITGSFEFYPTSNNLREVLRGMSGAGATASTEVSASGSGANAIAKHTTITQANMKPSLTGGCHILIPYDNNTFYSATGYITSVSINNTQDSFPTITAEFMGVVVDSTIAAAPTTTEPAGRQYSNRDIDFALSEIDGAVAPLTIADVRSSTIRITNGATLENTTSSVGKLFRTFAYDIEVEIAFTRDGTKILENYILKDRNNTQLKLRFGYGTSAYTVDPLKNIVDSLRSSVIGSDPAPTEIFALGVNTSVATDLTEAFELERLIGDTLTLRMVREAQPTAVAGVKSQEPFQFVIKTV